jgi:hypothetical protein
MKIEKEYIKFKKKLDTDNYWSEEIAAMFIVENLKRKD